MIAITWNFLILLLILIIPFIYVITRDNSNGTVFLSNHGCAFIIWIMYAILVIAIYGGIYWW